MARQTNPFALLDDEDAEDVMSVVAKVESKMAKISLDHQGQAPLITDHAPQDRAFTAGSFETGRADRGRGGRGGRWRGGGGRGRFGGGVGGEQHNNGYHPSGGEGDDGWVRNGGRGGGGRGRGRGYYDERSYENGSRHQDGGLDGWEEVSEFHGEQGVGQYNNGYHARGGYGDDAVDGGWAHNGGRGVGGRGRERGYYDDRGYMNGFRRQDGGASRWEEDVVLHGERVVGNGSITHEYVHESNSGEGGYRGSYGARRTGFGSGDGWQGRGGGGRFGRGGRWLEAERKDDSIHRKEESKDEISASEGLGRGESVTTEVPEESSKQHTEVPAQEIAETVSVKKDVIKVDNEMTLDEYERLLSEKRKALEVVKTEGRLVDGKEFVGMQIVDKKKDSELVLKPKHDSEKPKQKDNVDKVEKSRKVVSINEFLRPRKGERYYGPQSYARQRYMERMGNTKAGPEQAPSTGGRQDEEHGVVKGGQEQFSQKSRNNASKHVKIQLTDPGQFPGLH